MSTETQKFHISEDGVARPCNAQPGSCKYGKDTAHYATEKDARLAYEFEMKKQELPEPINRYKPSVSERIKAKINERDNTRVLLDPANGYVTEKELQSLDKQAVLARASMRLRNESKKEESASSELK